MFLFSYITKRVFGSYKHYTAKNPDLLSVSVHIVCVSFVVEDHWVGGYIGHPLCTTEAPPIHLADILLAPAH